MNKKINVKLSEYLDSKSKFVLLEPADQGDYFFIEDVIEDAKNFDQGYFDQLIATKEKEYLENLTKDIEEALKENIKADCASEFELNFKKSNEYLDLLNSKNQLEKLKDNFETQFKLKQAEWRNIHDKKIDDLLNELKLQKQANENLKKEQNYKIELAKNQERASLTDHYLQEIKRLQLELVIQKQKVKDEITKALTNQFNEEKSLLEAKINRYERASSSIQEHGQNLENWVTNQLQTGFESDDQFEFISQKTYQDQNEFTGQTQQKRADFELTFLTNKPSESKPDQSIRAPVFKAILECKTSIDDAKTSKKEKDYYLQTIKYAKLAGAKYAVLVSELEVGNNYLIRKVKDNDLPNFSDSIDLFVVRPQALMTLLHLLKRISVIEAQVMQTQSVLSEEFELKKNLIQDFEDFKTNLLETTIKNIKNNLEKILKFAENIKKNSEDIIEQTNLITQRHLITFEKKLISFNLKLNKQVKKLSDQTNSL